MSNSRKILEERQKSFMEEYGHFLEPSSDEHEEKYDTDYASFGVDPADLNSSGLDREIGLRARGLSKGVLGGTVDLPFVTYNTAGSLAKMAGNKYYPFSKENMGNREVVDPRTGYIFTPVDVDNFTPITPGASAGAKIFDTVTGDSYKPKNREEEKKENQGDVVGSLLSPSGVFKAAGKLLPKVGKAVADKAASSKLFRAFAEKPSLSTLGTGVVSQMAADGTYDYLDKEDPKLAALLSLLVGVGSGVGINLAKSAAIAPLFKGTGDVEKYAAMKKYGLNPTAPDVMKDGLKRTEAVRKGTANIQQMPFIGEELGINAERNAKRLHSLLDVEGLNTLNPEHAGDIIKQASSKTFKEQHAVDQAFKERYRQLKGADAVSMDRAVPTKNEFRPTSKLSPDEFAEQVNKFVYEHPLELEALQKNPTKTLDSYRLKKHNEASKFSFIDDDTREPIKIDVKVSADPSKVDTSEVLSAIKKFEKTGGKPTPINKFLKSAEEHNGLVPFDLYEELKKGIDAMEHPVGDYKFNIDDLNKVKKKLEASLQTHIDTYSLDPKAYGERKKYWSDIYKDTPKDSTRSPLKEAIQFGEKKTFDTFHTDSKTGEGHMHKVFEKNLDQPGAAKLFQEVIGEEGWTGVEKNNSFFNINKAGKAHSNLSDNKKNFRQNLYEKANPGTSYKVEEIFNLASDLKKSYQYFNTSGTGPYMYLNKMLTKDLPSAGKELAEGIIKKTFKVPYKLVKTVAPFILLQKGAKTLQDPKFVKWVIDGSSANSIPKTLNWIRKGADLDFLPNLTAQQINKAILKGAEEANSKSK